MNFHDFAAKVKAKYPEYSSVDDLDLTQKVLAKYPEYRDNIDQGDLTAIDNLAASSKDTSVVDTANSLIKGGGAGISDIVSGNGLQQAATDINKIENDEEPETTAGKVGSAIGGLFTPAQIALQGAISGLGLGEKIASVLKGWSADAAVNAVGKIKTIAKAIGIKNLDALGEFLLQPVMVGKQEFPAIVTATSSPSDMLEAVQAIKRAAGKALGTVSEAVDTAIGEAANSGGTAINGSPVMIDLAGLKSAVAALKASIEDVAPTLGKAVVAQYEAAATDLDLLIKKALQGDTQTVFSDLSDLKTTIGDLVYRHGSPLESKAALNDVYKAISTTLDDASKNVGGTVGAAYDQANAVYHQATAIESALEGKVIDAAKWFDTPSFLAAMTAGFATHGPLAAVTVPATYVAAKTAQNYGPQAIASGLNAAAPFLGSAFQAGMRIIPPAVNAIKSALTGNE